VAGPVSRQVPPADVNEDEARARFAAGAVARLATAGPDGRPHIVPVVFAVEGDRIYSGIDEKPKKGSELKRLKNIAANPLVSILVDHYEDEWRDIWWVRADGVARLADDEDEVAHARGLLRQKYPQYEATGLAIGGAIVIDVRAWRSWSFS
jgi:PPOX class probable F420-dependent enzyme